MSKRDLILCALNNAAGQTPEWIEVLPQGPDIKGLDGRAWRMASAAGVVAASQSRLPVVVDYEHASELLAPKGHEAPASGWITAFEARDGAVWGRVEWTPRAANMIAAREYRFVSPVFRHSKAGDVLRIESVGLVNQPNLKMTALCRRDGDGATDIDDDTQPATKDTCMDKTQRIALCRALGLADEAADDAILTAVAKLKADETTARNRAETPPLDKFVPRADFDKVQAERDTAINSINADKKARLEAEITTAVDAAVAAGKIPPATKDYHVANCRAEGGLDRFKAYVAATPVMTGVSQIEGKQPGAAADGGLTEAEKATCRAMGIAEDAYLKARGTKAA